MEGMEVTTIRCGQCGTLKGETNHWIVAVIHPDYEGILFQPLECIATPRNPELIYKGLCGQGCSQKELQQWLDDLKRCFTTQGNEAA
jgi:hypothetical protein